MPFFIRDGYAGLITSGAYLLILVVALKLDERPAWVVALLLVAALALLTWMSAFRRGRAIANTPTSRIASAAQGYVELYGRAVAEPADLVRAKGGSLPCVWFRCVTYRKNSQNKWEVIERRVSDGLFAIEDGSGRCLVDPEQAEVVGTHRRTWYQHHYKHVEEQLFAGDNIYVLGEFATLGGAQQPLDRNADVAALLAEWKRDMAVLRQRFDLDGDGTVDLAEWELARRAAQREVERQHHELRLACGVHVMRRPASGRLFLLSSLSPQQLRRKYLGWSAFHLLMFFVALAAAAALLLHGGAAGLW